LARYTRPDLKVLFVTGYSEELGVEGPGRGDPLIKKPFKPADLAEAVRQALRQPPVSQGGGNVVPLRH
jgi:hypothetical protein